MLPFRPAPWLFLLLRARVWPLPHPAAFVWPPHPPPEPSTARIASPARGPCARPFLYRAAPAPPSPATIRSSVWQCTPSFLWANHPSAASHRPPSTAGSSPYADLLQPVPPPVLA